MQLIPKNFEILAVLGGVGCTKGSQWNFRHRENLFLGNVNIQKVSWEKPDFSRGKDSPIDILSLRSNMFRACSSVLQ